MIYAMAPGRNEQCHCGLPNKYKHCCLPLEQGRERRGEWIRASQSLKERNLTLIAATSDIFGLNQPWDVVKAKMSDARIREFYQFIAGLWQPDTDYLSLLPKPDSSLRALYLGENDPEMMLQNVFRFSLYADQIILVNPFDNPNLMAEKFNPIIHPEEWRVQTLRLVYHLRILAPWIVADLVTLIPDPGDFDRALRMKTFNLATKRLGKDFFNSEDMEATSTHQKTSDLFYLSPPSHIANMARESIPNITNEEIEGLLAYVAMRRAEDPLLPNDTLDKMPGQMTAMRLGANLEMGLFMCQTVGAFPYTNVKFRWKEILSATDRLDSTAQVWSPLTNAFSNLNFKFLENVDSKFAVEMRKEGRLEGFRAYMRKLWDTVDGEPNPAKSESLARDFKDELAGEYAKAQAEWSEIDRDLMKWAIPAIGGVVTSAAAMVTGHYTLAMPGGGLGLQGVNELIQSSMKRRAFRKKTPLSVFIDLDKAK
jgi:hypothetical protein